MIGEKLLTDFLLALSMAFGYSSNIPAQTRAEAPILASEQKESEPADCLEGIKPLEAYIVSKTSEQETADQKPKYATLDKKVELYAILKAKVGREKVYFTDAPKIKIGGKTIKPKSIKRMSGCRDIKVEWFKLEPTKGNYAYVRDTNPIDYKETSFSKDPAVEADVHPTILRDQFKEIPQGVGVMHYRLIIKTENGAFATSGVESRQLGGLSDRVHRISYRPNTRSWVDFTFELFETPYVFASLRTQVDSQIGSDCADLVVYAKRREEQEEKGKPRTEYTFSTGLRSKTRTTLVTRVDSKDHEHLIDEKGNPIYFGKVKEGDIVYYPPIKGIGHTAILYSDSGIKGYLDCADLIIQTLAHEPEITFLCESYYGIPQEIMRWKK